MGLIDRLIAYRELGLRLAPCNRTGEPDKLKKALQALNPSSKLLDKSKPMQLQSDIFSP